MRGIRCFIGIWVLTYDSNYLKFFFTLCNIFLENSFLKTHFTGIIAFLLINFFFYKGFH